MRAQILPVKLISLASAPNTLQVLSQYLLTHDISFPTSSMASLIVFLFFHHGSWYGVIKIYQKLTSRFKKISQDNGSILNPNLCTNSPQNS